MDVLASRLVRNPDFAFRRIEEEGVLIPVTAAVTTENSFFALNETGARIWELIDDRLTGAQVRAKLEGEFDVPPRRLAEEFGPFVGLLFDAGVLRLEAA